MALARGARIGVYEILGSLGSGGMGEVYRARDTKLRRDVALKVLPAEFTANRDRVARFEREARLLASLNHPHIGGIYGFENDGDVPALVLELLDGDTLSDRVSRGPLPVAEATAVAQQIADALDAAHAAGIIHRDLKPANIKITTEGIVKVLDFGIARTAAPDASMPDLSKATMMTDATQAGVILGTAAYMSPEQARGIALDKRTDIWAFGCVFYEMLTGRLAFPGATMSDTIAAIIDKDPEWSFLPAATPTAVRRLLRSCLDKDPRRRLRDMGDVRHLLQDAALDEVSVTGPAPLNRRQAAMWLLGGIVLAAATGAGWVLWAQSTVALAPSVQVQRLTDFVGVEESPALSPDGKTVAFVARVGTRRQIWVRLLAGGAPLRITRDDVDHEEPRWTPDSSALIYYAPSTVPGEQGTIWEVAALGGEPRRVASALSGGDISHDGRHIALFRFEQTQIALVVVTRDGSAPDQLRPVPLNSIYEHPRWSPDDRWIACQQDNTGAGFNKRILVVSATLGGDWQEIARGDDLRGLSWLPGASGIVYSSSLGSTVLYPPTFNLRTVERDGTGDRQLTFGDVSYVAPDVRSTGMLTASRIRMQSDIWKFPINGTPADNTRNALRITHQTGHAQTPAVSADESEVVFLSDSGGHGNLWIARTDGSGGRQITFESNPEVSVGVPVWSPTGDQIVFLRTHRGVTGLSVITRDGSGLRELVVDGLAAAWSADGRWVYYSRTRDGEICVEKIPVDGGPPTTVRCGNSRSPAPSADGATLFFAHLLLETNGMIDHEIRKARPENGPSELLARVAGSRVPVNRRLMVPVLSPDGRWLTMPLSDGATTNIWALPTNGEAMRPLTDFGERSVVIARRVSWSPQSQHVYAAVADTDADIVVITSLLGVLPLVR